MNKTKVIRLSLVMLALGLLAAGCSTGKNSDAIRQPADKNRAVDTQILATPTLGAKIEYIKYQGVEGKNALDLLKGIKKVTTKNYSGVGEFVDGIDGVGSDSKHFWSFYVNGAQATVGAGAYTTKSTDVIEWKYEAIK